MADDRYKWIGQSNGTIGAEYAVASNWIDVTTGADPSPVVPGASDAIAFDAVPFSSGIVSFAGPESAGAMTVSGGTHIQLLGAPAIPSNSSLDVQTLTVQSLSVGMAGSSDSGTVDVYGVVLNDLGTLTLNNGELSGDFTQPGGIVVGGAAYTPHADVHVEAGSSIVTTGTSTIADLTDFGLVMVAGGTLSIVNPAVDGGGVSGPGTIDVAGGATLNVNGINFYHNVELNSIGTLHLEQGGVLNLGSTDFQISGDFVNANTGTGNSYNPLANVIFQHSTIGPPIDQNGTMYPDLGGYLSGNGTGIALGGDAKSTGGFGYTIDLGTYHVGDTLNASYTVENTGTAGAAALRGAIQTAANGATIGDAGLSGSGVTAQNFGPIAAGSASSPYQVTLAADQSGQSTLAQLVLPTDFGYSAATLDIVGTGYNYAVPVFESLSGGGTLSHAGTAWTLDLGTLAANSAAGTVDIAAANAASGLADSLSGTYAVSGSGFTVGGTASFSGIAGGGAAPPITIAADTSQSGTHSETITLNPAGSNPSGYSAALAAQTLTVTDNVTGGGGNGNGQGNCNGNGSGNGNGNGNGNGGDNGSGNGNGNGNGYGGCQPLGSILAQIQGNLNALLGNLMPQEFGKTLLADLGKLEGAAGNGSTMPQMQAVPWLHSS